MCPVYIETARHCQFHSGALGSLPSHCQFHSGALDPLPCHCQFHSGTLEPLPRHCQFHNGALTLSQPQKHPDRISIPSGRSYILFFCAEAGIFKSDIPYRIKTDIVYTAGIHSEQEARVVQINCR